MGLDHRVLMLSKLYEPLEILCWQRAISLVVTEQARVLEVEAERFIHTANRAYPLPSVIQHFEATYRHNRPIRWSRANLYARDDFSCCYCGHKHGFSGLTYDHVLPRSRGGRTTWNNIVTACKPCNKQKGSRTPEEARMCLRKKPTRPGWAPTRLFEATGAIPELWKPYLNYS